MDVSFMASGPISWSIALAISAAAVALMLTAKKLVVRRLARIAARTPSHLDDIAVQVLARTHPLFMLCAGLYLGSLALELPARSEVLVGHGLVVGLLLQMALWGDCGLRAWLLHYRQSQRGRNAASTTSTAALGFFARSALWLLIVLMVMDNLGVNITTLIASLGVGGIAVALALQNILGDIFSSLSIVLDKPFVIGDFIIVDDVLGTVEYVGLKTTRLRSLGGEQIIFSNSDLLKSRIRNYQHMQTRRIAFAIGVTYQTTAEQLRAIPAIISGIVGAQEHTSFERAHFKEFAASSLNFEVVYHVDRADYGVYMHIQQEVNLALFERFAREGIAFAHPISMVQQLAPAARAA